MTGKKAVISLLVVLLLPFAVFAQETKKDKGIFVEPKNAFWEEISKRDRGIRQDKSRSSKSVRRRPLRFRRPPNPGGV